VSWLTRVNPVPPSLSAIKAVIVVIITTAAIVIAAAAIATVAGAAAAPVVPAAVRTARAEARPLSRLHGSHHAKLQTQAAGWHQSLHLHHEPLHAV
jgi:hypothetical protein